VSSDEEARSERPEARGRRRAVRLAPGFWLLASGFSLLVHGCAAGLPGPEGGTLEEARGRSVAAESSLTATLETTRRLVIDLPAALELAGGRDPEILMARLGVTEARNLTLRRELSFLPTVYPLFRAFSHQGQAQTQSARDVNVTRTNYELQVLPAFQWDPGPVMFHILAAKRREDVASARLEAKRLDTMLAAASDYFDLVRAYAEVAIAHASAESARSLVRFSEARVRAGAAVRIEELRARALLARRQQEVAAAVGHVARASAALASLLLLDPDVELVPRENFPLLVTVFPPDSDVVDLVGRARTKRPELAEGEAELEAREDERDSALYGPLVPFVAAPVPARAAYPPLLPTLAQGAGIEPSVTRASALPGFGQWGPGGPWNYGQFYGPDSPFGDTGRTGLFGPTLGSLNFSQDFMVYAGVRFGPGGVGDVSQYRARALAIQSERTSIEKVEVTVQREVSEAKSGLVTANERLDAAREQVVAAEEAARLERDRFEKGVAIQLDTIEADDALVRARSRELEAIVDYDVAQYRLLRAVGSPP
jgi:outer membrane protein TolC